MNLTSLYKLITQKKYDELGLSSILEDHRQSNDYRPYFEISEYLDNIDTHLYQKSDRLVVETCLKVLEIQLFDIQIHIIISRACQRLDQMNLYRIHHFLAKSIMDHILNSGTGKDFQNAFTIFYPRNQLAILKQINRHDGQRKVVEHNEMYFDVWSSKNRQNLYFNINTPYRHLIEKGEETINTSEFN